MCSILQFNKKINLFFKEINYEKYNLKDNNTWLNEKNICLQISDTKNNTHFIIFILQTDMSP